MQQPNLWHTCTKYHNVYCQGNLYFNMRKKYTVISYVNAKYRRVIKLRLYNLKLLGEKVSIALQIVGKDKDFWIESRVSGDKKYSWW